MFDRAGLKQTAKAKLKGNLVQPTLVNLVVGIVLSFVSTVPFYSMLKNFSPTNFYSYSSSMGYGEEFYSEASTMSSGAAIFPSILALLVTILVLIPISTALTRYFIRFWRDEAPTFGSAFNGFSDGRFGPYIGASLWQALWLCIWMLPGMVIFGIGSVMMVNSQYSGGSGGFGAFLMFVGMLALYVAVIYKAYSYYLTEYIIADNHKVGARKSVSLSKNLMKGHKWEAFVVALSFIGWFLLIYVALMIAVAFVAMGINGMVFGWILAVILGIVIWIGSLVLQTYMSVTFAGYYDYVVADGLQRGIVSLDELGRSTGGSDGTVVDAEVIF